MAKKNSTSKSPLERLVVCITIFIFLVLPILYFPGRAASYVTSKQYFLIGAVDVLAVLWIWLLVRDGRYRLMKKTMLGLLPLALLLVALTISAIVGVSPATSFFSTVESGTGLIVLYHLFLLACVVASLIQVGGKRFIRNSMRATLIAAVILAIATFFTGVHGVVDINSTILDSSSGGAMMGNALLVGAYFIFAFFFAIILFIEEPVRKKKAWYAADGVLLALSPIYFNAAIWRGSLFSRFHSYFIFGEARIATVSLILGLVISWCIWAVLQKNKKRLRIIGAGAMAVLLAIIVVGTIQVTKSTSRVHRFFVEESGNRILDWQESLQGIKARPIFGWGPENFHVVYQQYLDPVIFSPGHGDEVWALHPHNNTIEVAINGGIVALVLYVFVLVSLFINLHTLRKKDRLSTSQYALLVGMLIAFILQQQMIYDSITSYMMFFFIIAMVSALSAEPSAESRTMPLNIQYLISIMAVIIFFPIWLYTAFLPAQKMHEFQGVASAHSDQRIALYQHLFHSAGSYAINTDAEFYTSPLFYSYSSDQVAIKNNTLYQKIASQELKSLLTAVQPVWEQNQYDYHLTLSLIQIENLYYYLTGDHQALAQADRYAARALLLSPTDPQIYVNYAQTVLYEKNLPKTKALLEKAIMLNSTYQPAIDFKNSLH